MGNTGDGPDECPLCDAAPGDVPAHIRRDCPGARAARADMGLPPEGYDAPSAAELGHLPREAVADD